ncbi:MAG: site-2 protease family protein [Eubacterium sp.]|nr:site-2 protease family protein [Eubacterium sp.]
MVTLISLIRQGNIQQAVIFILSGCFVVFICSPIHELSHAFVAYKLGDNTAKKEGRLTFNPISHIDPIGMIMILLFGFGYAKPVPVDMRNFKNPKSGMALTALAGPVSNIIMAFISIFIVYAMGEPSSAFLGYVKTFFEFSAIINVSLGAFNLIPIPPLDGSKILAGILPNKTYYKYMQYERYAMIGLLVLLATGVLDKILNVAVTALLFVISIIPHLIFS